MVMRETAPCKAPILGLVAIGVLALGVLPGLSLSQQAEKPKIVTPAQPTQPAPAQPADVLVPYVTEGTLTLAPQDLVITYAQLAPAQGDERERKIKDLEDKLQALLKEVKSLRETKITTQPAAKPKTADKRNANPVIVDGQNIHWSTHVGQPNANWVYSTTADSQQTVTLSRATYKMPKEMAEALAAFLKHARSSVVETKVEDDSIVITTTPNMQQTIGQLVGIMTSKPRAGFFQLSTPNTTAPVPTDVKRP